MNQRRVEASPDVVEGGSQLYSDSKEIHTALLPVWVSHSPTGIARQIAHLTTGAMQYVPERYLRLWQG